MQERVNQLLLLHIRVRWVSCDLSGQDVHRIEPETVLDRKPFKKLARLPGTPYYFGEVFVEHLGPGFWRRIDLPKAVSSLVMKSSSANNLPVRSCRRSASDSVAEQSVEREVR
jgi:hypothetical protein